jgi:hypothetical protein
MPDGGIDPQMSGLSRRGEDVVNGLLRDFCDAP